MRDWAREHGYEVNDRGRVPADVVPKYEAASRPQLGRPAGLGQPGIPEVRADRQRVAAVGERGDGVPDDLMGGAVDDRCLQGREGHYLLGAVEVRPGQVQGAVPAFGAGRQLPQQARERGQGRQGVQHRDRPSGGMGARQAKAARTTAGYLAPRMV